MNNVNLSLQENEQVIVQAASEIFGAYVVAGDVTETNRENMLDQSIRDAVKIARKTDEAVQDEGELPSGGSQTL